MILAQRSPILAVGLTAALLSLAGIPPFVGFFAKLYLFLVAIQANSVGLQLLVVWALIMSAVSLHFSSARSTLRKHNRVASH